MKYVFLLFLLTACSAAQQSSLLTDQVSSTGCPNGGCANTESVASGLTLKLKTSQSVTINALSTTPYVEVSGDCSPGGYLNNKIRLFDKVLSNGTTYYNELNYALIVRSLNVSSEPSDHIPTCVQGRFNFMIDSSVIVGSGATSKNIQLKLMGCNDSCTLLSSFIENTNGSQPLITLTNKTGQ